MTCKGCEKRKRRLKAFIRGWLGFHSMMLAQSRAFNGRLVRRTRMLERRIEKLERQYQQ